MKLTEQEIEQQAAIAHNKDNRKLSVDFKIGFKEGFNEAISQMQPEWVSVEDRLPEVGLGGVQILLEDSHSKERFQQTANYDGEWIFLRDPAERVKVICWHYLLPQPPTK